MKQVAFTLCLLVCLSCNKKIDQEVDDVYILKGSTVGTTTDTLHLFLAHENPFSSHSGIKIPVTNKTFNQKLYLPNPQGFIIWTDEQIANGGGVIQSIFLEPGITELVLHNDDKVDSNKIKGSKANKAYKKFQEDYQKKFYDKMSVHYNQLDTLRKNKAYGTPAYYNLKERQQNASDYLEKKYYYTLLDSLKKIDQYYTPEAKYYEDKIDSIMRAGIAYKYRFINTQKDIVSYHLLLESVTFEEEYLNYKEVEKTFTAYETAFPDHSYTSIVKSIITGKNNNTVGKPFLDFTAPTINGDFKTVSHLIQGKVAVLDLWASWCGPCIAKSKKLIPIYEEYKDKGFTVVGVANETGNTNDLREALDKYRYPWINLVELDKAQNIWQRYGIRGGGALFLIDENGIIVAVNPSPYEVSQYLKEKTLLKM